MKPLLLKYPVFFRFTGAIILFTFALIVSGFIDRPILKKYFPFTSVILLLLVTALLYKWDNKSLKSIGLNVTLKNLSFFPLGILIGAIAFMIAKYFRGLYTGESFGLTTAVIDYKVLLYGFYTILPAVIIEELLFRGYVFKKTIEVSNVVIANIIFGVLFMLVHILDREIIQNRAMVLFLMITIPVGHLLFATALLKSKTLFFPIGIHLGNNWATRYLITKTNNGESIFFIPDNVPIDTWKDFIIVIIVFNAFFLFVTYLIWKWDTIIVRMKNYLAIF